jgi:L-lactate dehydrogenase complex protein LldF
MRIRCLEFSERAKGALRDEMLQQNLQRIGVRFKTARDLAFAALEDPESLREMGRALKEKAIANLPLLLETLEMRVKEAGGVVHWACTSKEARNIVCEIARTKGVRTVVKGKSMVTEEISLNEALQAQGIEVWETDLGEFIIQLAGEPPSHIIGPAVHKSKEQIADLFAQKLGVPKAEAPEELTRIAREKLREKFLNADMGVTGANAAVAETGSILLLENEGNIRMSVTMPRILVTVMGIEKVIATLDDLAVILALLPRSATGQKLSAYSTIFTGPRAPGELDGPEEFHLVLLDNGRTRILADPDRRQSLFCLRCGSCLNVCPVYRKVGGHAYGWVYSGPIGAILTPQLIPPRLARELPFASTLCGACAEVCPVKIDLPKLLLIMRQRLSEDPNFDGGVPLLPRLASRAHGWILTRPRLYRLAARGARLWSKALTEEGRWKWLPPPVGRWGKMRDVPAMQVPFSERWKKLKKELLGGVANEPTS